MTDHFSSHPLLGRMVRHTEDGRVGVLVAQLTSPTPWSGTALVEVFVRPVGGGLEWTALPDQVTAVE